MSGGVSGSDGRKIVVSNRKARHEYDILETVEAGVVLTGPEIKSIRAGKIQLADAHARIEDGEMWVHGMHIAPYEQGGKFNLDPVRPRKLLLKRREIDRLIGKVQEKGLSLVPLNVYLRRGFAKVDLALAKSRKLHDRRQAIAEREARREQARALSER
jgi:SsrA-binding protein